MLLAVLGGGVSLVIVGGGSSLGFGGGLVFGAFSLFFLFFFAGFSALHLCRGLLLKSGGQSSTRGLWSGGLFLQKER